jgi:restriction system protein
MSSSQISIRRREEVNSRYNVKYIAEVTHRGLNDYKAFTSTDEDILENKVDNHVAKLEERWEKIVEKKNVINTKEENLREAQNRTQEAIWALERIDNILRHTLSIDDTIDWDQLKDKSKFKVPKPVKSSDNPLLQKPDQNSSEFQPKLSFLDNFLKSKKEEKIRQAHQKYQLAIERWANACDQIEKDNNLKKEEHNNQVKNWEEKQAEFYKKQEKKNAKVEEFKKRYSEADRSTILEYCELVLNNSVYPESFPKSFELDYNPENKILIVEYALPSLDQLPTLNEVKFIRNELKEYHISDTQHQKMFDATMYNITLRTIHELFEADKIDSIEAVTFNGWVNAINKATGKKENNCILSIQAKRNEFLEIDLAHVDPKVCFKTFKGVASSKLVGLTPIQPILQISRTDKRFVNHYEVAKNMDDSTNIAAIPWEDFEHLIREIFEKEFSGNGGEVKVTQASRDGGVDAIAFDPDPIRGGKIVIQAKRYTNTVGVSAVRDLFGTVMNEGATKGILVTTADYGPDAYEFAKGKPLTLMNGANLLYLLEKHGHKAKIDIKEAKLMQKDNK